MTRGTIDLEIERAIDRRLAPAVRRRVAPLHFAPLFEEPSPSARRRRRWLVGLSVAVHVAVVLVVILMPRRAQTVDEPMLPFEIVFTTPAPVVPEVRYLPTPPKQAPPAPKPKPKPDPEPVARTPDPVVEAPKPALPEPAPLAKIEPPKPRPVVKTGLLDEAPAGPGLVASRTSRSSIVVGAGFDGAAGSAATTARPGRVSEVAFDATPAKTKARGSGLPTGAVQGTSFDESAAPRKPEPAPERRASVNDSEVEILSKPKPVYTEEARTKRLEGDVVLDVLFEAAGRVRVLGVSTGLGHGLDEAAIEAAKKIRFNPAKRDGTPVDYAGKLRVVFRLA